MDALALRAIQDHGGLSAVAAMVTDPWLFEDQAAAAQDWMTQNYPPLRLGVFAIDVGRN